MKNFSKLCTPAKVYFGIAAIATLFDLLNGVSIMLAFWKLVFAFIWTFILGGLCDKGYKSISWFLVLLPYILMFLASLNIYHVTDEQRQFMRSIQLQGAFGQEAFTEGVTTMTTTAAAADREKKAAEQKAKVEAARAAAAEQAKKAAEQKAKVEAARAAAAERAKKAAEQKAKVEAARAAARAAALSQLTQLQSELPTAQRNYDEAKRGKKPHNVTMPLFNKVKMLEIKIEDIKGRNNL